MKADYSKQPRTLPQLNRIVAEHFPKIFVVKNKDYFYIASEDEPLALKIADLYCSSIYVYRVSHLTIQQWIDSIRSLFTDNRNNR